MKRYTSTLLALWYILFACEVVSAQQEIYWQRPYLKARVWSDAQAWGWDDQEVEFNTRITQDTGLQTRENDSIEIDAEAYAEDGLGDAWAEALTVGKVKFNPPDQAVTTAFTIMEYGLAAGADGGFASAEFWQGFVKEAKHVLCSDVHDPGTPWLCVQKCVLEWSIGTSHSAWFDYCDWVFQGYPGTPTLWLDGDDTAVLSYWDTFEDELVEVWDWIPGAGGIYEDIPAWLEVGDEVYWISSEGTGEWNLALYGYLWDDGMDGGIMESYFQLDADTDPEN